MRAQFVIPVIASILILGTFATGIIAFANFEQCANDPAQGKNKGAPFLEIWAAICDLQTQINTIELIPGPQGERGPQGPPGTGGALSCENQIEIKHVVSEFQLDEECISGYDLGITVDDFVLACSRIFHSEPAVCLVTITNFGPKDAIDVSFTIDPSNPSLVAINCVAPHECFVGDIPVGESVIFDVELTSIDPRFSAYRVFFEVVDTYPFANSFDNSHFTRIDVIP